MNTIEKKGILTLLIPLVLAVASPSLAETKFNINEDTKAFADKILTAGRVKVKVSYTEYAPRTNVNNLRYQIFYDNNLKVNDSTSTSRTGSVFLQDLDADKTPEVIIESYTGGAHCCTEHRIYSWQKTKFIKNSTDLSDGNGGSFEDLGQDGKYEYVTYDNAFLYRFSSYAGSYAPSLICALKDGKLVNVTRRYPKKLKSTAWDMYKTVLTRKKDDHEVNGALAGYVAQKALLGEFQQGWGFMLANYDRKADRNFPNVLKAFLIKRGYLTRQGTTKN